MSKALDGYAVLITGGSTGLGLSHARVLGQRGAKIAITDFKQGNLDQAAAELHKEGLRPLCLKADNRVVSDVKGAVGKAEAEFGKIDVLVNNAAINPPAATILQDTLEDWRRTIAINLESVYMGSKLVAPHLVARKSGRIISIASIQGFASSGECGAYNAAKGAIIALTKSMAVELGPYDILVNAVAPGFMLTPMSIVNGVNETETPDFKDWYVKKGKVPLRRTGYPEDVSGTVIFLASKYCRYMTGLLLVVDGGLMSTF